MKAIVQYLSLLVENVWNFSQRARSFMAQASFRQWFHLLSVSGTLATLLSLFGSVFKSGIEATVNLARGVTSSKELFSSLTSNPLMSLAVQSLNPFVEKFNALFGGFGGWFCWFFGLDWVVWCVSVALMFWVMGIILRLVFAVIQALFGLVSKVVS